MSERKVTDYLDPNVADPDGTITCTCGEIFTGARFAERLTRWHEHLTTHAEALT